MKDQSTLTSTLGLTLAPLAVERIYRLAESEVIIIDTETTGFAKTDQIIELGAINAHTEQVLVNELYKPTVPIGYCAMKVHGIRIADVKDKPVFDNMALYDFMDHIAEDTIITGWNLSFDMRMIEQSVHANGNPAVLEEWKDIASHQVVDMMDIVKDLTGKGRISQNKALELFGVDVVGQSHRAVGDCMNLAALMRKLFKLVEQE